MTRIREYAHPFKHFVYRHVRLDKNEPFYIGIGTQTPVNFYQRAKDKKGRNFLWNRIVDRTDYRIDILFESDDYNEIKQKEHEFVCLYGLLKNKTGTLCNLTMGGDSGHELTEKTKRILREKNLGKKQSEAAKLKRSISGKKSYQNPYRKRLNKNIYQYDINGFFIKKHYSILSASEEIGCSDTQLGLAAKKKKNHYAVNNFWFMEYQGPKIKPLPYILSKQVVEVMRDGVVVSVHKSYKQTSIDLFGNRTYGYLIGKICKGLEKSIHGYNFRHAEI